MTAVPDGSVVITPRDMYDQLVDNTKAVEKLTEMVGPAISDIRADVAENRSHIVATEKQQIAHGNRLTVIETKVWAFGAGLATVQGAIAIYLAVKG